MTAVEGAPLAPAAGVVAAPAIAPARVGPADLTLTFVDEATVRGVASTAGDPAWLLDDRLAGLAAFEALPMENNPLYTGYVDLRNAHLADVRSYSGSVAVSAGAATAGLPGGAAAFAEITENRVTALVISQEAREAGLILETLDDLGARDPELLRHLLEGGCALPENDKLAQMTRAMWSQGLLLRVPDGVRLDRPVALRWVAGTPGTAIFSRTVISVGADAEVSVVEEQLSMDSSEVAPTEAQALFAGTTEAVVGAGSVLSFAGLQDLSLRQIAFQHRSAVLGRGATVRWALAQLGSRVVRSRIDNRLEGDGSTVEQAEIVFGSADQLFDLTSYTRHVGRDTTGNLLSKGALADRSRVYMKGLATIDLSAHGTDSYLGEFGMLLSKQARSVAIPSLEIDQPDCRRVAHASSVGPIDETQLFYLESRGLDPEEARKFIVLGYLEPVVARVPLESAQDRLRELLEAKWAARIVARPEAAVA
ncbi:MAG: SufD family Fe-S cluster assembly protein [Candidatus Limnocylindrales bacterium]|jgi:Fe-S cluster assembly scaffold protein SufB